MVAAKSTEIIKIILIIYRAYYNVITVWCAQSLGIILACILECTNKTLNLPNGVASDPDREFCQILYNSYRVVIQITIDQLPKKFICTLFLYNPVWIFESLNHVPFTGSSRKLLIQMHTKMTAVGESDSSARL